MALVTLLVYFIHLLFRFFNFFQFLKNHDVGIVVLNKPGDMPIQPTLSNHSEDVTSMYTLGLKERHGDDHVPHVSIPLRMETEMNGLLLVSTKKEFCAYMMHQIDAKKHDDAESTTANGNSNTGHHIPGFKKSYRCLVCIKDPNDIDRIEQLVNKTLEHYVDVRSPAPKKFQRLKPNKANDWQQCLMRITKVGGSKFRAACVSSMYSDSNDFTLAHRLWGPNMDHPAEKLGVSYVMQLEVELLTARPHQIRGQLAMLGCPIVGDYLYGGGTCEMRMHRHMWQRMAVQCCDMEFALPKWEENEDKTKKVLVASEEKCTFHLNTAWWTEYLVDYEKYL